VHRQTPAPWRDEVMFGILAESLLAAVSSGEKASVIGWGAVRLCESFGAGGPGGRAAPGSTAGGLGHEVPGDDESGEAWVLLSSCVATGVVMDVHLPRLRLEEAVAAAARKHS